MAPSLITFPLSKVGLQPLAENGRVVVLTQAMPCKLVALAQDVCPRGRAGSGRQPRGSAHVFCVHVCVPPGADMPRHSGCVCVCVCGCVCTRAMWAARGARLCVCENSAPTCAGTIAHWASGSSTCTALRGV